MPAITATRYWLDADDTIVRVCSQWDRFARQNDGASAMASQLIGKPLWPFITGDATRMWLDASSVHSPIVPVRYTVCPACRQPITTVEHCNDRGNQR